MRAVLAIVLAIVFAGLLLPEVGRYRAERRLGSAQAAFDLVVSRASEVGNLAEVLARITERAAEVAPLLPGESRGWILAGSSQLVAGNPDRALGFYREALRRGERAEIHLNLGRAQDMLGRADVAHAAFLRAVWISPALLRAVPQGFSEPVGRELERLEAELRAGRLKAPPPPPE